MIPYAYELFSKFHSEVNRQRKRIVIMGDAMTDRWVHGHREKSQDGCEKFIQEEVVVVPGGAANAQRCLSAWDVRTSCYSYPPNDCPIKTRYVENGKIIFRVDEDGTPVRGRGYQWARDLSVEMLASADAVLLSDYDKGFLSPEFIKSVAQICLQKRIPCVADCKREPGIYNGCIRKCNTDYQHKYNDDLARRVFDAPPGLGAHLVVTAGEGNPIVWDGDGPIGLGYDLARINCVNHVGAGDCFAAHLTLALACGLSLKESAAIAHSAGRMYVQHIHNFPPSIAGIANDMANAT